MYNYCQRWRLSVNTAKTKVIVFRKGGFYQEIISFSYHDTELAALPRCVTGLSAVCDCGIS